MGRVHPIVLIRHAVGYHNIQYDANIPMKDVMRDATLTNSGEREARVACPKIIKWSKVSPENSVVLTSPLRRCLQTCINMLSQYNLSRLPIAHSDLIEIGDGPDCKGTEVAHLKKKFPMFEWSKIEEGNWWRHRNQPQRPSRALRMLRGYAKYRSVIAFTHGNLIEDITDVHLHNCEAIMSRDGGKTWEHLVLGRSRSRFRS